MMLGHCTTLSYSAFITFVARNQPRWEYLHSRKFQNDTIRIDLLYYCLSRLKLTVQVLIMGNILLIMHVIGPIASDYESDHVSTLLVN